MSNMNSMNDMNTINTTNDSVSTNSPISFTNSAVVFVSDILAKQKEAIGLRLGVKKSGCSGLGYVVDCAVTLTESDRVYESEGIQIVIDDKSLPYLKGMIIDCVTEGLNQSLIFKNPNATGACGCGESFSVQ